MVSGAYGGFSNVWGAQIMPFSKRTFERWPITWADMEPHYRTALGEMTLAGEEDDLSELFPLMAPARPLPPAADRTERILARYRARRALVRSHGVTLGRARLAFRSDECTRCGLCMTGCPHQLIYSSSHTFDRLRAQKRITYRPDLLAVQLDEVDGGPHVLVQSTTTGRLERMEADRIFVACGGIGTTRLVLGSLGAFDQAVYLQESVQFVMPTVSMRPVPDPRRGAELHPQPVQPPLRRHRRGRRPLSGPLLRVQPGLSRVSARIDPGSERRACAGRPAATCLGGSGLRPGLGLTESEGRGAPDVRREGPLTRVGDRRRTG